MGNTDGPYAKDIAYLSGKIGPIDRNNRIYQKLNGKRNVASVRAFLETHIDNRLY